MHCAVLTDPFVVAAPKLLEQALFSLSTVFACCWPRIDQPLYRAEIIKALAICFLNIQDDTESEGKLKNTKENLLQFGKFFGGVPFEDIVAPLIAKEPELEILFKPASP